MKKAFTLVELLVSISLLAIVSAGVVSIIGRGPQQASRDARRQADLQKIATALELYRNDVGRYPTTACYTGGTCLTSVYIQTIPRDPSTGIAYQYTGTGTCTGQGCTGFNMCANLEKTTAICPTDYVVTNP